jgi:hypothetical protein
MAPVEPVALEATVALVAMVPRVSMVRAQVNPGPVVVLAATVAPADWQELAVRPVALEPRLARMVSAATAETPEMAGSAAQVLTERLGLPERLPVNPGPTVKPAATAVRADLLESAVRPAALEPRLVKMASPATAGTPEMAGSAAQVLTERLGLMLRLPVNPGPTVKPAATVAPADWQESAERQAALEPRLARMVSAVLAGTPEMAGLAARAPTERLGLMVRLLANPGPTVKQAAMVAPADWQELAVRPAALEPRLARMASPATAGMLASVGRVATVPPVRMGRLSL